MHTCRQDCGGEALFSLASRTLEVFVSSAKQTNQLTIRGADLGYRQFKEVVEVALYARKMEIELVKEKLDLLIKQDEHEWQTALSIHVLKLKEETSRYDQMLQIQDLTRQQQHLETTQKLEHLTHGYKKIESASIFSREEEAVYCKHQRELCFLEFENLQITHRMDVDARCQIADLLIRLTDIKIKNKSK